MEEGLFEEVVAVAGVHGDVDQRGLAQDPEGNRGAGGTSHQMPQRSASLPLRANHLDYDINNLPPARSAGVPMRLPRRRAQVASVVAMPSRGCDRALGNELGMSSR